MLIKIATAQLITLPNDLVSDVASSTTAMLNELSPFITLIVGTLLALTVLVILINAFHK